MGVLIAGRVLQGFSGAVVPLAYGIIRDTYPRTMAVKAFGTFSVSLGIGAALGAPLAGLVIDRLGTSAVFIVGGLGALPILAAPRLIRDLPSQPRPRLDGPGAVVLALALAALLLALTQGNQWGWAAPITVGLLVATIALGIAWVRIEQARAEPLMDIQLLGERALLMTNVSAILSSCGVFASLIPLDVISQIPASTGYGLGLSPVGAGLLIVPHGVAVVLCARPGGGLCLRIGARATLVVGSLINALACVQLVFAHNTIWLLAAAAGILGVGQALILPSLANLVVAEVPPGDVGVATAFNTTMRTVGMALGSACSAALLTATVATGALVASESGFVASFVLATAVSTLAVVAAMRIPRPAFAAELAAAS